MWCGPNSTPVLAFIHAARKIGLVAVPAAYRFTAEELQYVVDNSDATLVVVDAEHADKVAAVRDQLPKVRDVVVFGGAAVRRAPGPGTTSSRPATTSSPTARRRAPGATMIYTSGTTGKPKGALRTSTDPELVAALLAGAAPPARRRGAHHDRAAVPLGPAGVGVAQPHPRRHDRPACATSTPSAGSTSSASTG